MMKHTKRTIAVILTFTCLSFNIVEAKPYTSDGSKATLAPYTQMGEREFMEKVAAGEFLLGHGGVNQYIREQIKREQEIFGPGWWEDRVEFCSIGNDIIRSRDYVDFDVRGLKSVAIVKVAGLYANTGQPEHVGLSGSHYGGIPVIYIDSMYANTPDRSIQKHAVDEILQWERLRKEILHINKDKMRKWIKRHINEPSDMLQGTEYQGRTSRELARTFHETAYPIEKNLFREFPYSSKFFNLSYINDMLFRYGLDSEAKDVNIAAHTQAKQAKRTKPKQEDPFLVLVINCGSSSVKYQLIDMRDESVVEKGIRKNIGETEGPKDHNAAILDIMDNLKERPVAIGHRVVHGGEKAMGSLLVTDDVEAAIEEYTDCAPDHNPHNLLGIRICKDLFPGLPQVAVFDTGFHNTMPPEAYRYALPEKLFTEHGIRRFGFHGTSHRYVSEETAKSLGKPLSKTNVITVHLGNGSSIAAVKKGKSVDTSMGMTPESGIVMGGRGGDFDSDLAILIEERTGMTHDELKQMLKKESGLMGLSGGLSNDVAALLKAKADGDEKAKLALDIFVKKTVEKIFSYFSTLGGHVDAIVLTGGIGTSKDDQTGKFNALSERIVSKIRRELNAMGIPSERMPRIMRRETNEELVIARDTKEVIEETLSAPSVAIKMESVSLPKNPYRHRRVVFAGIDAIDRYISPAFVGSERFETKEIRRLIKQLAMGYVDVARKYEKEHGKQPKIAALSYNTLNPAKAKPMERSNVDLYIIDRSIKMAKAFGVKFYGPGCMQLDVALMKSIAEKKTGSRDAVQGIPDVFAFPCLHAYDITKGMLKGYSKIIRRDKFEPETFDINRLRRLKEYVPRDPLAKNIWTRVRAAKAKGDELPIILLPEGHNEDILTAGLAAQKQGLARVVFMYKDKNEVTSEEAKNKKFIRDVEKRVKHLKGVSFMDLNKTKNYADLTQAIRSNATSGPIFLKQKTGKDTKDARKRLMKNKCADALIYGIDHSSSETIVTSTFLTKRGALYEGGTEKVYDFCPLRMPSNKIGAGGLLFLVNTVINQMPTARQIAEMAVLAMDDFKAMTGKEPKVALLRGGDKKPKRVIDAWILAREMLRERCMDEDDIDRMIKVSDIGTAVEEGANILVPPDLTTGNICYKSFQRLLGAKVWGLDFMGTTRDGGHLEVSDLSRGADAEEVFNTILLVSMRVLGRDKKPVQKAGGEGPPKEFEDKVDIKKAVGLIKGLVPAKKGDKKFYDIRYDEDRLRDYEVQSKIADENNPITVLNEYVRLLKLHLGEDHVRLIKKKTGGSLITVNSYRDQSRSAKSRIGKGEVNVKGELKGHALRMIGMVNMAIAASLIPDKARLKNQGSHTVFVDFIKEQYKLITGEKYKKDASVKAINLRLPKADAIEHERLEDYYRQTLRALHQSA